MGDKIEYSDLFSPDTFSKAVDGINSIKVAFEGLSNEFKQILVEQKQFQEGFKVKSYDDIVKLNKSLDDSVKTIKEYTATQEAVKQSEIELAKIRAANAKALQEEEKAKQQAIRTEKLSNSQKEKQLSLYQKESQRLNELRKAYKELALAGRENGVVAKGLIQDIQQLDAKLKKVDASVGQFQRNVGNYTGALDTFRTGVTNILGAAGIGVGLSQGVSFIKDSINEFASLEEALKNLQAITGVSNKDLEFFKDNAEELGINVKGGAKAVVEAYKLIGSAKPELLENKDALNAVTESAILLSQAAGLELPDAATRLTDALNQYGAGAEKAAEFTNILAAGAKFGAAEVPQVTDALLKFGVAAKSSNISIQESVGAIELLAEKGLKGAEAGTALRNVFSKLSAAKALPREAIKELEAAGVNIKKLSDSSLNLNERLKELSKIQGDATAITRVFGLENKTAGEILISNLPRLEELTDAVNENGAANQQAAINTDTFANKQLRLENTFASLKASIGEYIVNGLNPLINSYDILRGKLSFTDAFIQENASKRDEVLQKVIDSGYEEQQIFLAKNQALRTKNQIEFDSGKIGLNIYQARRKVLRDELDAFIALINEKNKDKKITKESKIATDEETNAIDRNTKAISNNTKVKKEQSTGSFEDAIRKQNEELNKDQEELDFRYAQDKKERDAKQREEDFDAALKEADRLLALEEETNKKAAEDKKKAKEDELKDLADLAQKTLQIAEKEIKAKEKLREDALNKEIEDRENNVERQRQLADKGLQNTLAFEEQRLAEAERRKEDEAKKSLKREKTLAFFKLFAANAEKDPNTALQKTIVETLLADAVAGAFFKGTEKVSDDLKGNKVHNGRDGYVVAVDGSERVLTGEQNKMIGNMSNEDLAKLANDYQNGLLPKYAITDSMSTISTAQNMVNSAQLHQLVSLNKNIEDLKQTIINKKEVGIAIDNFGNVLRTEIENGVKRVEIIKNNKPRI